MQQQVKIISFNATKFGIFKAFELDFSKFKQGILAIKGKSGEGKSTVQKALKVTTQGRDTLADAEQYGEEWTNEIQLLDGEKKVFIEAKKEIGKTPEYHLFEKDLNGKKVQNPIIDGVKATPAKYIDLLLTELTFGMRDFLSDSDTVHRKFMMKLFEPELNKLGVDQLKKELEELTSNRDYLRNQCQHSGAYASDFERDGYKLEQLAAMEKTDVLTLEKKKNELLISKGKASGDAQAEYARKKSEVAQKGTAIVEECRKIKERIESEYLAKKTEADKISNENANVTSELISLTDKINSVSFLTDADKGFIYDIVNAAKKRVIKQIPELVAPVTPVIDNGRIIIENGVVYEPIFNEILAKRSAIAKEYSEIKEPETSTESFDAEILQIESQITAGNFNNKLIERYQLNRQWVEASGKVEVKRNEIAKMYAQINTGVDGLYMKPFYNEDGKMEIKTVYTGLFDPEYFKNKEADERLLVSYSSTQRPLIGILLQVARLKMKGKYLPYIFLDDVPMDKKSQEIIARIAEENSLTIITSITGDFDKEKLETNELLIEGGEVFFS